jgi:hypothetical protein
MHTAGARAEAERRHAFLLDWLAELERELTCAAGEPERAPDR